MELLKSFIRSNYKSSIIILPFVLVLAYFGHSLYIPFFFLLSIARDYYHYEAKQSYINRSKPKALRRMIFIISILLNSGMRSAKKACGYIASLMAA